MKKNIFLLSPIILASPALIIACSNNENNQTPNKPINDNDDNSKQKDLTNNEDNTNTPPSDDDNNLTNKDTVEEINDENNDLVDDEADDNIELNATEVENLNSQINELENADDNNKIKNILSKIKYLPAFAKNIYQKFKEKQQVLTNEVKQNKTKFEELKTVKKINDNFITKINILDNNSKLLFLKLVFQVSKLIYKNIEIKNLESQQNFVFNNQKDFYNLYKITTKKNEIKTLSKQIAYTLIKISFLVFKLIIK
ncbi:hypothetical protein [[Mycoplasma] collis]|uniref:hypothetical protein n=1 Tax=[Mycoplasma] collis TaxID=2127 RepID=UPI00051CAB46|nr:hypothetical protein [[Mycoplasma] collis]